MPPTRAIALFVLPLAIAALPRPAHAQFGYPPIYPAYMYAAPESDLRIAVKPPDAAVYVDGYFAGKVDDYDGTFQRLHIAPGQHEIVVYLEGYRSLRQRLYLEPFKTRRVEGTLEKLAAGETPEPTPVPVPPPDADRESLGARPSADRAEARDPDQPSSSVSGTLSIRVQPSGSSVLIDGERWAGPADSERLIIQLPEGRHRVEAQRDGYTAFVTDVEVRAGQTVPVNISLTRQ